MEQAYYEGFEDQSKPSSGAPPPRGDRRRRAQKQRQQRSAAEQDLDPQYGVFDAVNPKKIADKAGDGIADGFKKALDVIKKPIDEIKKFIDFLKELPKNVWNWLVGFFGGAVWIVMVVFGVFLFAMLSGPVVNAYKTVQAGGSFFETVLAKPGHGPPLPKSSALGGVTSFIKRGGGANSAIARYKTGGITSLFSKSAAAAGTATAGMTSMASALGRPSLAPITGMRPTSVASVAPTPSIAPTMKTMAATFPRGTGLPPRV